MKNESSHNRLISLRILFGSCLGAAGLFLALIGLTIYTSSPAAAQAPKSSLGRPIVVQSSHNDVSKPVREMAPWPPQLSQEHEAAENPLIVLPHKDAPDLVVDHGNLLHQLAPSIPPPLLNFNGIPFPGVVCNCAPPDTNGEVGATQYVQIVNQGYQVFDKATGNSVFGPASIASIWSGFGGVCQTSGFGDPVMLYDQVANRWVISQFAGSSVPTDECIAVSTSNDATGSYNRYDFHLGTNFFDYPKIAVWPDAYYMSMNVFNSSGTAYLGPQPFAFDRTKMLAGQAATYITFSPLGGSMSPMLPADLEGATAPPSGAPDSFVLFPGDNKYHTYHFHVDFATPTNSTFTLFSSPAAAAFTELCPGTRACVPEEGVTSSNYVDGLADRLMFRLSYRNFGDHESLVSNYTVNSGGVAGVRWFELRGVTSGPETVYQESTYQPDSTWRWMGSVAMDGQGNLAVGFSASSSSIFPQIRYAGRLSTDPLNKLAQGEAHLYDGAGSQTTSGNRWGDYSDLSVDPVDDATFWYTNEYYDSTSGFNWRTRIGSFKLASGGGGGPTLVSASSVEKQGKGGTFAINLPLTGPSGVEDRNGGGKGKYQVVLVFSQAVTSVDSVTTSCGSVSSSAVDSGNPTNFIVNLTGVTCTGSNVNITVSGVHSSSGTLSSASVPMGLLVGDVNGDRTVSQADLTIIKGDLNQTVNSSNFRADVTTDGKITKKDTSTARAQLGTSLP